MEDLVEKVLVTGGAGYLGSILVKKLLQKGYKVRVLDNLLHGGESILGFYSYPNFEFFRGEMRNPNALAKSVDGVDAVLHLAAVVGDQACNLSHNATLKINYVSTKNLVEACKRAQVSRLVFASTCSVYGHHPEISSENSPLNPLSLYARSKILSEEAILDSINDDFYPTILRMATIYGLSLRMRFDLVVNAMTVKAVKERKVQIFGGNQWRPNVHVDDAADAFIQVLEAPPESVKGEIFNVGSNNQNYQIVRLGEIVQECIPETDLETFKENLDPRDYRICFDKISNTLGYKVKKKVEDGVLEIRSILEDGIIEDYTNPKYNNYVSILNGKLYRLIMEEGTIDKI
jgi:nucleoside-diphosphate-sugar epimerase